VAVADIDLAAAERVAAAIGKDGGEAIALRVNVTDRASVKAMIQATVRAFGRLDVMFNNAGISKAGQFLEATEADWARIMGINGLGVLIGMQEAAKQMIAQGGGGRIINMTSVHEDWPMPGNVAYCVSKGGTRMLTRTAGVELGPHGIQVVNIAPGAVATPINASTMGDPAKLKALDAAIPLGRMAEPAEIAGVVVFLASGKAAYMTATTVVVDGGIMQGSVGL